MTKTRTARTARAKKVDSAGMAALRALCHEVVMPTPGSNPIGADVAVLVQDGCSVRDICAAKAVSVDNARAMLIELVVQAARPASG